MEGFCWARNNGTFQPTSNKTDNSSYFEAVCPGSNPDSCEQKINHWHCVACKGIIYFVSDGSFHCLCGRAPSSGFQFKCNKEKHGTEFLTFHNDQLTRVLQENFQRLSIKHQPKEEVNILIVGATGVGKSTWVNAMANYLSFSTLEDAKKSKLISVIPASFTLTDKNFMARRICIDEVEEEDDDSIGQSVTKEPKSYVFHTPSKIIRLIDTPGIGDTRGIEQDKKNFESILKYISNYKKLNGICVLLKPNNSKLTTIFRFCIQELLKHLHPDAGRNIVFCFTNARTSNFEPGEALPCLRALLDQLKISEVRISKNTMYYLDNESFRYLCSISCGMEFPDYFIEDYVTSWEQSSTEVNRLLDYIGTLSPHHLVYSDIKGIVELFKPVGDICQNIVENIVILEHRKIQLQNMKKKEMINYKETYDDVLVIPVLDFKPAKLDLPKTICTSKKCVVYREVPGLNITICEFPRECHNPCYLNTLYDIYPNIKLEKCEIMTGTPTKTCHECDCSWENHMNITYEFKKVVVDIAPKEKVASVSNGEMKNTKNRKKSLIEKRILSYKHELDVIKCVTAKFGHILKQHSLMTSNDILGDYYNFQIKMEEGSCRNSEIVKELKNMSDDYKAEVNRLQSVDWDPMQTDGKNFNSVITELENQLYELPISGKMIRETVNFARASQRVILNAQERHFTPKLL